MFKRYDLSVYCSSTLVYSGSFSSINNLVKFSCGFDSSVCELDAVDTVFERSVPLEELCNVFRGDTYGI